MAVVHSSNALALQSPNSVEEGVIVRQGLAVIEERVSIHETEQERRLHLQRRETYQVDYVHENYVAAFSLRDETEIWALERENELRIEVRRAREVVGHAILAMPVQEETEPEEPAKEKKTDLDQIESHRCKCCNCTCCDLACCGSNSCNCLQVVKNKELRRVQEQGIALIKAHVFPLFSKIGGELAAIVELITALVMVCIALPTFLDEFQTTFPNTTANYTLISEVPNLNPIEIVRFSIAVFSLVLAGLNCIVSFRHCNIVRCVARVVCKCIKTNPEPKYNDDDDCNTDQTCWQQFKAFWIKYINDSLRLVIVELLIYPTLICDVLDNATGRTYEGTREQKIEFVRFILSCARIILHVYVIRLLVLGSTIHNLEKVRRGKGLPGIEPHYYMDEENRKHARRGLILEIFFAIHVCGQMLFQVLAIAAIWSKVVCENSNPIENNHIIISPMTWVLIVLGLVVPVAGTFTFFIPTYYWAQEYPIDFMFNFVSALEKTSASKLSKKAEEIALGVLSVVRTSSHEYFCWKLLYPFIHPLLIILSVVYNIPLTAFFCMYFFGQTSESYTLCGLQLSYQDPWFIFMMITLGIVFFFNIVVILSGYFWTAVVCLALFFLVFLGFIAFVIISTALEMLLTLSPCLILVGLICFCNYKSD